MRKKMRYLPVPVDLKKAEKKQWVKVGFQKKLKKNNVEKEGPPKVEKKQWVKVGPKKLEKNNVDKVGLYMPTYFHIPPYTFIYPRIPLYTFIYPHIHKHIQY